MFISPPNNFNQSPMWNTDSMFSEPPMTPMPKFGMYDDTRQTPMPGSSTSTPGTTTGTRTMKLHLARP